MKLINRFFKSAVVMTAAASGLIALGGCATNYPVQDTELENGENDLAVMRLNNEFVFYQNQTAPQVYRTDAAPEGLKSADLKTVEGTSCQVGFAIPLGAPRQGVGYSSVSGWQVDSGWPSFKWGNGGYAAALDDIYHKHGRVDRLYDVKVDVRHWGVLVYREQCLVVTAKAAMKP